MLTLVRLKRMRSNLRTIFCCSTFIALLFGSSSAAYADLRVCNMTSSRIGIAIGYRTTEAWRTEGWWNLKPNACESVIPGDLSSRFYYLYAQDYDRGGEWSGTSPMCTRDRQFTIEGIEDCLARGSERSKFFEVDTGEQKSWTIQLNDPTRLPQKTQ